MKFLVISFLAFLWSTTRADAFSFYQNTVSVKIVEGRSYLANNYQKEARVTYAQQDNRFILSVDDIWIFNGKITKDEDGVTLYDLDDESDSGHGKCDADGCKLWFKWNIGGRSSAKGRIVTKLIDNNTLELKFGMTGYWFPDGPMKVDFTDKLKKLPLASSKCNLPSPHADLHAWIDYCSSL